MPSKPTKQSLPVIELRTSQPSDETRTRMLRVMSDVVQLKKLPAAEARALYEELEATRDTLSRILDRADGK